MRCINCNADSWKNVDEHRLRPEGMSLCQECGMISYPSKWKTEEEIKQHYRSQYRAPPNASNYFTGQRKCHFHQHFLSEMFEEWMKSGKKDPEMFEVGAAYGLALSWFQRAYPGMKVAGSELTTSYRRNAFHEFGIRLEEDFDKSRKYDLIMSYKVAEHQLDADQRLAEYAECLKPGGYLYISVPTWFDSLCNFGMPGFDLEYYYAPDHINVWTRPMFENILLKAGFEIVKKDYVMYDSTYLCKVNLENKKLPIFKQDPKVIEEKLTKVKAAYLALSDGQSRQAIDIWPDYPTAWATNLEMNRKALFEKGWLYIKEDYIAKVLKACTNIGSVWVMITDLAMRAKQWKDAIEYAEAGLRANPENPTSYQQLMNIMREMALEAPDDRSKIHYWEQARNVARHGVRISAQHFKEMTDHAMMFNAQIPIPKEKANVGSPLQPPP